jgi:hypothetical protein
VGCLVTELQALWKLVDWWQEMLSRVSLPQKWKHSCRLPRDSEWEVVPRWNSCTHNIYIGLFTLKVKIYETNNCGRWYDFGFLLGVGAFGGGASKSTQ